MLSNIARASYQATLTPYYQEYHRKFFNHRNQMGTLKFYKQHCLPEGEPIPDVAWLAISNMYLADLPGYHDTGLQATLILSSAVFRKWMESLNVEDTYLQLLADAHEVISHVRNQRRFQGSMSDANYAIAQRVQYAALWWLFDADAENLFQELLYSLAPRGNSVATARVIVPFIQMAERERVFEDLDVDDDLNTTALQSLKECLATQHLPKVLNHMAPDMRVKFAAAID